MDEIRDIMPDVKRKIQEFITSAERAEIPEIQDKIKKVQSDLAKNKHFHITIIDDIEKQREILKSELDDITNGLIKSCRDLEQGNEEILLKHNADLHTVIDELKAQIDECKDALQSSNDIQIIDISNDIPSMFSSTATEECSSANFTPGKLEIEKLRSLMGELEILRQKDQTDKTLLKHQPNQPSIKSAIWRMVSKFTPYKGCQVVLMCAAPYNQVWVSLCNSSHGTVINTLLLVDNKGIIQQTLELDVSVLRFCLHPTSGNVWFVSCDDKQVREVTSSKSKVRFETTGNACSICIAAEGNIYMGELGEIVKYSQNGKVLCRTGGTAPIRNPYSITLCPVSGNLVVVDFDSEEYGGKDERSIVILSDALQLLHKYHGDRPGHQSPQKPFKPFGACYNSKGEIIITDNDNRSVILLNHKGEYLQTLYTDSEARTGAVTIQDNGDVFVSLSDFRVLILTKSYQ